MYNHLSRGNEQVQNEEEDEDDLMMQKMAMKNANGGQYMMEFE